MEIILIFVVILLFGFFISDINGLSEITQYILGFGMIAAIGGLILFRIKRLKCRCRSCKRNWALKLIDQRTTKTEKISVLVELEHRDLNRNVTGTHDQYIPGNRKTLEYLYQCKYCGNIETRTRTEDRASI